MRSPALKRAALACVLLSAGLLRTAQGVDIAMTTAQLEDFVKGGWLGKTAGGAIGGPYEFWGPDANRQEPSIDPNSIGNCNNDDVYAQVPFMATMYRKMNGAKGIYTATMIDYGNAFKNTTFALWCGNAAARNALQAGVLPPTSGAIGGTAKWRGNAAGEAIDWQIECEWIGFVNPGLPAAAVAISDSCGQVLSYANGLYAARLFVAIEALAPVYKDVRATIAEAQKTIPVQCDIHKNIDTLLWYYDHNPTATYMDCYTWAVTQKHTIIVDMGDGVNLDSRLPCSLTLIALLYGGGDAQKTIDMAMRMGGDCDCTTGDAGALVGCFCGYAKMPQAWRTALETGLAQNGGCSFSGTGVNNWNIKTAIDSTLAIAKKSILDNGGTFANDVYTIHVQPTPPPCWLEVRDNDPVALPCQTSVARPAPRIHAGQSAAAALTWTNGGLSISFSLPRELDGQAARIDLFDMRGELVRTPACGPRAAGSHCVTVGLGQRQLTAGHYLARIRAGHTEQVAPVVLSR